MKVPQSYYDEVFPFKGDWDLPSACGLRIHTREGRHVVIVTELYQENPGTSVTAAGERLFTQICRAKDLDPARTLYVECNPNTHSVLSFYDEKYFLVTFPPAGTTAAPQYRQLTPQEVTQYI